MFTYFLTYYLFTGEYYKYQHTYLQGSTTGENSTIDYCLNRKYAALKSDN